MFLISYNVFQNVQVEEYSNWSKTASNILIDPQLILICYEGNHTFI